MTDRLYKKIAKVSVWRDTIPTSATSFVTQQLVPGEQLDITQMRIRFRVRRALTKTPNQCDIYLYNLSEALRTDLARRPLSVQLEGGYDGVSRLLFNGDLHFGMSEIKGATWETLMQVGDGQREYVHARTSRHYGAGTTYRRIITDVAATMGLKMPANLLADPVLDRQFLNGEVTHGPSRDALSRLLAPFGYHWSTQNGVLRVLRDEEVSSQTAVPIDEAHGMMDTPTYGSPPKSGKPPHVRVKMELYPELTPGDVARVTSKSINGLFRIENVDHDGDTHAKKWTTEVELQPF